MSEQEWRDTILREITGPFSPSPNPESHDHGLWQAHRRLTDRLMAAVAPLRERERQHARQEAVRDLAAILRDWAESANVRHASDRRVLLAAAQTFEQTAPIFAAAGGVS